METIKTVKGISSDKWMKLKILAAERNVSMGEMISGLIDSYSKTEDAFWESIFTRKSVLSEREAKDLLKVSESIRKEKGFRV